MRDKSELFTVNGSPLYIPDSPMTATFSDIRSSDSGMDESGVTHNIVIRKNIGKWNFVYGSITEEEKNYIEGLFGDGEIFTFGYPSRVDSSKKVTCNAYRTSYGIAFYDMGQGLWKNYKFTICEC